MTTTPIKTSFFIKKKTKRTDVFTVFFRMTHQDNQPEFPSKSMSEQANGTSEKATFAPTTPPMHSSICSWIKCSATR